VVSDWVSVIGDCASGDSEALLQSRSLSLGSQLVNVWHPVRKHELVKKYKLVMNTS
jgi:hypothetical protein